MKITKLQQFLAAKLGDTDLTEEQLIAVAAALFPSDDPDVTKANLNAFLAFGEAYSEWEKEKNNKIEPMTEAEADALAAIM